MTKSFPKELEKFVESKDEKHIYLETRHGKITFEPKEEKFTFENGLKGKGIDALKRLLT